MTFLLYIILSGPLGAEMIVTTGFPSEAACRLQEADAVRFYRATAPGASVVSFCIPDKSYYEGKS